MAFPYKHLEPFSQRVFNYCDQQISELQEVIRNATAELEFFTELRLKQNKCESCGGEGKLRDRIDMNEYSDPYNCPTCNGTGEGKA